MEPLKDQLLPVSFFQELGKNIASRVNGFDVKAFTERCEKEIPLLELKDRLNFGAELMHELIALDYPQKLKLFYELAETIDNSFSGVIFPTYIERHGVENRAASLEAIHYLTRFSTGEFAIRPFLDQDLKGTLDLMLTWASDENEHVRRLASEGSRPKLPWASQVKGLRDDPKQTLAILKKLNQDESLYVRKSVGNHLNDVSKDHPEWLCKELATWDQSNKHTKWIIGRAIRSMIKDSYAPAFALAGFEAKPDYEISAFELEATVLNIGDATHFSFELISKKEQYLNIDFAIDYQKKNGRSKKVFKLSAVNLKEGEVYSVTKKISFQQLSTRKHFPGEHTVSLLINGKELEGGSLELKG